MRECVKQNYIQAQKITLGLLKIASFGKWAQTKLIQRSSVIWWKRYLFSSTVVKNYHKLGDKTTEIYFFRVLEARSLKSVLLSQNQGISRAALPPKDLGGHLAFDSFSFQWLLAFLASWLQHSNHCCYGQIAFFSRCVLRSPPLFLIYGYMIQSWIIQDYLSLSRFLIILAKTFFPYNIWWPIISLIQRWITLHDKKEKQEDVLSTKNGRVGKSKIPSLAKHYCSQSPCLDLRKLIKNLQQPGKYLGKKEAAKLQYLKILCQRKNT